MKISKHNYPILEKLSKNSLGVLPFYDVDYNIAYDKEAIDFFVSNWKKHTNLFKKQINVVTNPFKEAAFKAQSKLAGLCDSELNGEFSFSGVYVVHHTVFMLHMVITNENDFIPKAFYVFNKNGNPLICDITIQVENGDYQRSVWVSKAIHNDKNKNYTIDDEYKTSDNFLAHVILFDMFKKYADVEIKEISPNTKRRSIYCIYKNEINLKVNFLDSKWFTTIVKSDAFKVSGHFRLQPKKINGEWTKELIWINDFEKQGYTSLAKKTISNA